MFDKQNGCVTRLGGPSDTGPVTESLHSRPPGPGSEGRPASPPLFTITNFATASLEFAALDTPSGTVTIRCCPQRPPALPSGVTTSDQAASRGAAGPG